MNKAIVIFVGYFLLITTGFATSASASECGPESYFSPSDDETPLPKPHPDFLKMRQSANAGDAVAQRNLAVCYESGYLVTQCPGKALYWYKKAATNGDNIAQSWMARRDQFERQIPQPEYSRSEPAPTGNAANVAAAEKGKAIAKQASKYAPKSASETSLAGYEAAERNYKICNANPLNSGCMALLGDPASGCWKTYYESNKYPKGTESNRSYADKVYSECLAQKNADQLYGK
jgi:hypothetical protein